MIFISFSEKENNTPLLIQCLPRLIWHPTLALILKYGVGLFPQFSCNCFRDPGPAVANPYPEVADLTSGLGFIQGRNIARSKSHVDFPLLVSKDEPKSETLWTALELVCS
jgi:hypothetical protein